MFFLKKFEGMDFRARYSLFRIRKDEPLRCDTSRDGGRPALMDAKDVSGKWQSIFTGMGFLLLS